MYTGCNDGKIRVYEPDRDEPLEVLEGHDACVTSLHLSSKTKTLISASWDCTAKVWINNKVKLQLSVAAVNFDPSKLIEDSIE